MAWERSSVELVNGNNQSSWRVTESETEIKDGRGKLRFLRRNLPRRDGGDIHSRNGGLQYSQSTGRSGIKQPSRV